MQWFKNQSVVLLKLQANCHHYSQTKRGIQAYLDSKHSEIFFRSSFHQCLHDDLCCLICNSASCYMGRSHNTGRTNSVVVIYPARGREHSVLTAHVPPPAFPSRGIAGRALSLPSVLDTSPPVINNKNMTYMRKVRRALSSLSVCAKLTTEAPPLPGNVYCYAAAGGTQGRLHTESGQDTFFSRIFFLQESSAT